MNSSHTVTRTPVGPMLVYLNGVLQRSPGDYTASSDLKPTISPVTPAVGDSMSVVFTRAVPLSFVFQGETVDYWGYALWQEDWEVTA